MNKIMPFLANRPLFAFALLIVALAVPQAAEAQYQFGTESTVDECDFAGQRGSNIRAERIYEMICWQNAEIILRETCLSHPEFIQNEDQLVLKATRFSDPIFLMPGSTASCILRHMREDN